jgi:hypothetical protein
MQPDSLAVAAQHVNTVGSVIDTANGIFAISKAILTGGTVLTIIGFCIKRVVSYATEHHANVTKHNTGREEALDKKEDLLFNNTAEERKQNFDLLKQMLTQSAEQTIAIKMNAENNAKLIEILTGHSALLQENTGLISKLAEAMHMGNTEVLNHAHRLAATAFEKYVDELNNNPELAKRILSNRNNPITAVMQQVATEIGATSQAETGCALVVQDAASNPPAAP